MLVCRHVWAKRHQFDGGLRGRSGGRGGGRRTGDADRIRHRRGSSRHYGQPGNLPVRQPRSWYLIYNVMVAAPGFKSQTQTGIVVTAQETHNAGKMALQIGSATDSVTVSAEAAQVQLNSS